MLQKKNIETLIVLPTFPLELYIQSTILIGGETLLVSLRIPSDITIRDTRAFAEPLLDAQRPDVYLKVEHGNNSKVNPSYRLSSSSASQLCQHIRRRLSNGPWPQSVT